MKTHSVPMFPPTTFSPNDRHFQPWFDKHLRILEETPLHTGVSELTIRFLWLRTFHAPLVIRIEGHSAVPWQLEAKASGGLAGRGAGKIHYREYRDLSPAQSTRIESHFSGLEFWYRQHATKRRRSLEPGQWLLEAATPERYRALREHAPEGGPIRKFCLELHALTRFELPAPKRSRPGVRRIMCGRPSKPGSSP